ncbi:MAG: hypothetical protein ACI8PZ_003929 [Myxococcota bacterium]
MDDRDAARHASDGGGAVTLVSVDPQTPRVGDPVRIELLYTAGPLGVAEGGGIELIPPAFWGWSPPQVARIDAPGGCTVETEADGVRLGLIAAQGTVVANVAGRALRAGEQVRWVYGAGASGARVDRFAERGAQLWIGVDGDGDGVRSLVDPPVTIDVAAGAPVGVLPTLPSTAEPGHPVRLTVAVLDRVGSAFGPWAGEAGLELSPGLSGPDSVVLDGRGLGQATLVADRPGVHYAWVRWGGASPVRTNPMVVRKGVPPILWGDLQIHTGMSDGTGSLDDVYRYARDVAALDVAVPTDHDHWGMAFLDTHPELWDATQAAAARWYVPGSFVTAPGFEWTNWVYGHRHVIFFADDGPLLSSLDPAYDRPDELWAALEGLPAITVAHHSAGGPVAVDWRFRPPAHIEPVTEIASVHGQSLAWDDPGRIYAPVRGNFVEDQLRNGLRVGFLGSTDGHDGHPGLSHLAGPHGGLAAIGAPARTREAVLDALRRRAVYATNGVRIILRVELGGVSMGGQLAPAPSAEGVVRVVGTAPLERVDVVGRDGVLAALSPDGAEAMSGRFTLTDLVDGDFVYVRVRQRDGGMAWSSPVFVE